ncbi:MAG: indole-3-glycerol phosphate synthase TrpC [Xanthomonadales bacterium]|nr:indole-3-glycerol phosphate synthase TrpC [Xanthomonadales bacterium]
MSDILDQILRRKREEVADDRRRQSEAQLLALARSQDPARGFLKALQRSVDDGRAAVISEFKRRSPSKGWINQHADPKTVAAAYQSAGASCLSVLTDRDYFGGSIEDLQQARGACALPALRKDFTVDAYQIVQARAIGADAILLIAAALSRPELEEHQRTAVELGLDVLVEVHDRAELDQALEANAQLLGVNNRNLRTFQTDLNTTLELKAHVPADRLLVTESGIHRTEDVQLMRSHGVHAFLVGEALMRDGRPAERFAELF